MLDPVHVMVRWQAHMSLTGRHWRCGAAGLGGLFPLLYSLGTVSGLGDPARIILEWHTVHRLGCAGLCLL